MSEACGQLRLAVSWRAVVPTRSASLTPLERGRGSINFLQEFRYANPKNNRYPPQANLSYEMNFDIGFMLENVHNPKCSSVTLEDSAKNFRAMAQSIIKILPESINHCQESNGDKFDIMSVLHAASGFLEAADYLDRLADERRN